MSSPRGSDPASGAGDWSGKPDEVRFGDAKMLRVAGLHISLFQFLEPRSICFQLARPSIDQAHVEPLCLRPQEAEIVNMGRVEAADQQDAMI